MIVVLVYKKEAFVGIYSMAICSCELCVRTYVRDVGIVSGDGVHKCAMVSE